MGITRPISPGNLGFSTAFADKARTQPSKGCLQLRLGDRFDDRRDA
jgi:hypothetical protein